MEREILDIMAGRQYRDPKLWMKNALIDALGGGKDKRRKQLTKEQEMLAMESGWTPPAPEQGPAAPQQPMPGQPRRESFAIKPGMVSPGFNLK